MQRTIPLDDKEVMSLVCQHTEALGITPDDIGGCQLGCSRYSGVRNGISQCRCLWIRNRSSFSDLVRIAGLSHGTDVWLGNAQTLIAGGQGHNFHGDLYAR